MEISNRYNYDKTVSKVYSIGNRYHEITISRNYSGDLTKQGKDPDAGAYHIQTRYGASFTLSQNEMLEFFSAFLAVNQEYEEINNGTD